MTKIIELKEKVSLNIFPLAAFNFDATVFVPQHFPEPDSEWQKGVYWQAMNFQNNFFGIKMQDKGSITKPKIELTIFSISKIEKETIKAIVKELDWRFGFNENISNFCNKFKHDRHLKEALKSLNGMRIQCADSLYELLIISIVLQNATVRRSVQMMNNLFNAFGAKLLFDKKELFAFWNPSYLENVSEEELKALKIGYRAKMIKKVSKSFGKGEINEYALREMSTEEAKKELLKLYGVGPATCQIILGEYLRKHDAFDLKGRLWEQKILSKALFGKKMVPAQKIIQLFERYGKWKHLAVHYIFTNLFWEHRKKKADWLEKEIRL